MSCIPPKTNSASGPERLWILCKCLQAKLLAQAVELVFPKSTESACDWQPQRVECFSPAVVDVEPTRFRVVRYHQHQQRPFGEIHPAGDSRLGPLGESQDRLILVQPLQSKVLQTQDVIDFYCVHTDLLVVWLIVNRVQILLTRHYRCRTLTGWWAVLI